MSTGATGAEIVGKEHYAPELLEHGRARARVERLDRGFVEGDAENLPGEYLEVVAHRA